MAYDQEREELKKAYPDNEGWKERVQRMPDSQVIAIYNRLRAKGKLGR